MITNCQLLTIFFRVFTFRIDLEHSVDKNPWYMNALWVQLSIFNNLIYLCNNTFGSSGHVSVKIPLSHIELQIA